ncbi:VTT domain-containing protein [Lactovum miscens]|uniref:Membrane-associated protein n=1 Tax=Lactovum miscens TaxID=190387 RepID=A0A841C988_9LACT|nr:DedA family protein [Lactovum miscens]MBB5888121.1 membrane-associated protein [Lactovum miscens]
MLSTFTSLSLFGLFDQINTIFKNFAQTPATHIWIYVGLGALIFIETGLVIFPFLPGDSVLFFVGGLAALSAGKLNIWLLILVMGVIAFLANLINYEIGRRFGDVIPRIKWISRILKPQYIEEAHKFFEKWGSWAIFLGRFMPIIRTVVPFVAGTGKMPHKKFVLFNFLGGFSWVIVALGAGYLLGTNAWVQSHFEIIMLAIVVISLLPAVIGGFSSYIKNRKKATS